MAEEHGDEPDGVDLVDRWLAHREETADAAPRPRTYGVPRTGSRAVTTREEQRGAPAPEAPDDGTQPAIGDALPEAPPTEADVELPTGPPTGPSTELPAEAAASSAPRREPVGLEDFEPVVIASVRRSAGTSPQRRRGRSRASTEPTPEHAPEPTPEPTPEPAPETTPETAPDPAPELDSHGAPEPSPTGADPRPEPEPEPAPAPVPSAAPPAPVGDPGPSRSAYDELRVEREAAAPPKPDRLPPDLDFRPRTLARRVTSALLLSGLVVTALAAWRAYDTRVETDIGLAAILALFTGVVWAVRAGSVPTRVSLRGGRLEVRTQAGRFVFEITDAHTHLTTVGTPGRRGWKLLVHRRSLAPFAITAAMVDPHELLEALRYYRPDL